MQATVTQHTASLTRISSNKDNRSAAHHRPTTNTSCTLQCICVCIAAHRPSCTIKPQVPSLWFAERSKRSNITETAGAQDKIVTAPERPHLDLSKAFVRLHESFMDIPNRPRPQRVALNLTAADDTFSMLSGGVVSTPFLLRLLCSRY